VSLIAVAKASTTGQRGLKTGFSSGFSQERPPTGLANDLADNRWRHVPSIGDLYIAGEGCKSETHSRGEEFGRLTEKQWER